MRKVYPYSETARKGTVPIFGTWSFFVISACFLFIFHYLQSRVFYFCLASWLWGGGGKGSEKKQKTLFFCLVIFPPLNYYQSCVKPTFSTSPRLQLACSCEASSHDLQHHFDGWSWVEVENHSYYSIASTWKKNTRTSTSVHPMKKLGILSALNKQHEIMVHGMFFGWVFFTAPDGHLRNRGCHWWGWGGALENMKSSTKIPPAHVSSITPASQISLRKFAAAFATYFSSTHLLQNLPE